MINKGISVDTSTYVHVGVPWVFYPRLYRNRISLMIAETGLMWAGGREVPASCRMFADGPCTP